MPPHTLEGAQNVNCIEDMIEKNVVKRFVQLQVFRIASYKMEFRVLTSRALNHGVTDFHADSVRGFHCSEKLTGFASNLENAFPRLYDVFQNPLEPVIEISIGVNPLVPALRSCFLMFPSSFTDFVQCIGAPGVFCCVGRCGHGHRRFSSH